MNKRVCLHYIRHNNTYMNNTSHGRSPRHYNKDYIVSLINGSKRTKCGTISLWRKEKKN